MCAVTGPSPYRVNITNTNLRGMRRSLEDAMRRLRWIDTPSVAISYSLCTRHYKTSTVPARINKPCMHMVDPPPPPRTSSDTCNDVDDWYNGSTTYGAQFVMIAQLAAKSDIMTTFESVSTITYKYCIMRLVYTDLGMALFDIECEDWSNDCTHRPSQAEVQGTKRIFESTNYTRRLATLTINPSSFSCP
ncbi:uncharacterized protein LOC144118695 [Amblyomma americanum]